MVRTQFVSSVYKALSGLVENAERAIKPEGDDGWILVGPAVAVEGVDITSSIIAADGIDARNRV
jgi:exocyst complex component 2